MDNLLEVKKLVISYNGKKILSDVSFNVEKGDFVVIFGDNGTGKSSLVKTLLGLLPPSGGSIEFAKDFDRRMIGYLPQTSDLQRNFPASVNEVVLSGCINSMKGKFFYTKKEKEKAQKNIKLLGIEELNNKCFRNLSGGQQQRVLLARALCAAGGLLLLDEPTSGLDPNATADFYETVCDINKSGTAIIMVSHDVHSSLSVAKHILHIGNHRALFFGTPQVYESGALTEDGGEE